MKGPFMEASTASLLTQLLPPTDTLKLTDPEQCSNMSPSASQIVPPTAEEKRKLEILARECINVLGLIPPLPLTTLRRHARIIIEEQNINTAYEDFFAVILGNAVWEPVVSAIPPERRLLLLPHCMRNRAVCSAEMDAFGLLCESCGGCVTGLLQDQAEEQGYVVLIAEGTTVVTQLLKAGKVDAVIGIGCLSALERSFPHLNAAAIPGLAIPLSKDGCENTEIDKEWVLEILSMNSEGQNTQLVDLDSLKSEVQTWFTHQSLDHELNLHGTYTESLEIEWMEAGGKRWRPLLTAAVSRTLHAGADDDGLKKLGLAVECFHKASLIHDDIEDHDDKRYEKPTMHATYGIPLALNAGDLLVGEGYRLIADSGAEPVRLAQMLRVAAEGHRDLCIGQGEELKVTQDGSILPVDKVIDIFRRKTAPAFSVALVLGAIYAGADSATCKMLNDYSTALGIAYQVRDDIEDFMEENGGSDLLDMRPSLLLALAMAGDNDMAKQLLRKARKDDGTINATIIRQAVKQTGLESSAWDLVEFFRNRALEALDDMTHQSLKRLLFQILYKILGHRPDNRRNLHGTEKNESIVLIEEITTA
ncbi:polyprenyl synthetase family protein [bacterium]|nr:polyprenyl synthetase family protein [bacterium]